MSSPQNKVLIEGEYNNNSIPVSVDSTGKINVNAEVQVQESSNLILSSIVDNIIQNTETQIGLIFASNSILLHDLLITTQYNSTINIYLDTTVIARTLQIVPNLTQTINLNITVPVGHYISVKATHGYSALMWTSVIFKYNNI